MTGVAVGVAAIVGGWAVAAGASGPSGASPATTTATAATTAPATQPARSGVQFIDVAAAAGVTTVQYCGGKTKNHLLESVGQGSGFVDYDDDGRIDIVLINGWVIEDAEPRSSVSRKGRAALYRNLGNGRFEDVAAAAGFVNDEWGSGMCAGDYDNDGRIDIYVTNFGPNRLFRNRGDGTFEEVSQRAGVDDRGWSTGCAFFDADGDGHLDLYVANYVEATMGEVLTARRTNLWRGKVKVMIGPFGMKGGRDHFFHNNGDGTFTDATDAVGMTDVAEGYGLGVITADLDRDGDVDVYVANDSNTNFLYRNDGHGAFTEIGAWCGAGLNADGKAQAGMGADAVDFDGDDVPDVLVTNFAHDTCTLYHGTGELFYEDVSLRMGLKEMTYNDLSWGCGFFDYDNDADPDILIVNGHIYPQVDDDPSLGESYAQLPLLIEQRGGRLVDVRRERGPGLLEKRSARGSAFGDIDNDGDLDILITAMDTPPLLLRNDGGNANHWLQLRLLDAAHGRDALNALVHVTAGGRTQSGELRSGASYASQNAMRVHFGLGAAAVVERVEIRWPGGRKTTLENVRADQVLTVRER